MNYTEVITLEDAKLYLRVDSDLTEDDASIIRMIKSSLIYIENWTNLMLIDRNKTYKLLDGYTRVYDAPINSVVSPTEDDITIYERTLHSSYSYGTDTSDLVLNVGYSTNTDVPIDLIEVGLELIDLYYYAKETGKTTSDLSLLSIDTLNRYKRFFL